MPAKAEKFHLDAGTQSLGCVGCSFEPTCGGMRRLTPAWSCRDLCCGTPTTCSLVCVEKLTFPRDLADVGGFSLSDTMDTVPSPVDSPPHYVPVMQHKYLIGPAIDLEWVAIPLSELFKYKKFRLCPVASSPTELRSYFGVRPATKIVVLGVGKDPVIERYWHHDEHDGCSEALADLELEFAITPNYSMFLNEPRTQHIYNRKRIVLTGLEFGRAGVSPVFVLQAVCESDWLFWEQFLGMHPEIQMVALEFQTGLGNPARGKKAIERLARISHRR